LLIEINGDKRMFYTEKG